MRKTGQITPDMALEILSAALLQAERQGLQIGMTLEDARVVIYLEGVVIRDGVLTLAGKGGGR